MKILPFLISAIITIALIVLLGTNIVKAPLARLLSPQQGVWQNAEPATIDYGMDLSFPALKGRNDVYFDDRLVPHVFAENDEDAFSYRAFYTQSSGYGRWNFKHMPQQAG